MDYLEGLNEPQKQAVLYTEGPLMVIAGAGSGKTRVLTNRIAHIMHEGTRAWNVLALTFTNKAAGEMRNRIEKMVGTDARSLWMGTFHSVFAKILRFEADKIGYTSNFSIYDTDDSKSLIKTIVKEFGLDDKAYKPNRIYSRISNFKNKMIDAQNYVQSPTYFQEDRNAKIPEFGRIYKTYQLRAFKANAMDFDDLLFNTNILFEQNPEVLRKYQDKFKYILIDEFQDTNLAQYLIVRRLSDKYKNLCVVGDDAQSIYAFRGADISNILNLEKDFPELKVIRLEQNYRSTQNIVKAANSIIANNKAQLKKNVWTDNVEGTRIKVTKTLSDKEEGKLVANTIFQYKQNYNEENKDFAVLYRTNAQSRSVEDALRNQNIKYRIIGGLSFYQRKEIKDLIAYLRFSVNQQDEEAFKRIINLPKRGIGKTTVDKILQFAQSQQVSIWEVLSNIRKFMTGRNVGSIEKFAMLIKNFEALARQKDAFEVAQEIAKMSGLLKELYEDKTIEGLSRYENVQELLNAIKEFTDDAEKEDKSLSAFLQEVSLLTSADEAKDDEESKVTLMTIHASKGLEFKNVFIVGLEENLFPSQMMLNSRKDLEEERRLFYVAVTRAEERLLLSYCDSRYVYGRIMDCAPSRFLKEIDPQYLEEDSAWSRKTSSSFERDTSFVRNLKPVRKTSFAKKTAYVPSTDFAPSDTSNLQKGMKVEHMKFGFGEVLEIETYNNDRKAKILFQNAGEKTLLLSFAKLKIHG